MNVSEMSALSVGCRIEAGRGEDRETGKVIAVDEFAGRVTIAWSQSAMTTTQPIEALEDLVIL